MLLSSDPAHDLEAWAESVLTEFLMIPTIFVLLALIILIIAWRRDGDS